MRVLPLVPLLVAIAGCASGDSDTIITDSAGVRIVTNHAAGAGWLTSPRMSVTQDLAIGADSIPEYQFGRIGDLAVSSNGDIAAIDQLNGVVRVFDSSGRHRVSLGRPGKGPGELSRSANGIYWVGLDSLLVLDPGERRSTMFALEGPPGATTPLPAAPMGQGWVRTPDGDFLMRGLTISRAEGRFVFWDALLSIRADGTVADTLLEFDYTKTDLGGPGRLRIPLIVNNPTWARLADGRIAWTALDRNHVQVHDSTGRLVSRITSTQWISRDVTPADRTAMVELLRTKLQAIGGDASFADSPQVEAPPQFPSITAVRAGPRGTIWVQLMGPVETIDPMAINAPDRADFLGGSTWHVLDTSGEFLGVIELPKRFRIFRVTDDALYGAARDDDGVERIVRLRLGSPG
ncbi:MAG TPA: hypothetical protein VFZ73_03475 [Gemmatimonadaceae bacterium]